MKSRALNTEMPPPLTEEIVADPGSAEMNSDIFVAQHPVLQRHEKAVALRQRLLREALDEEGHDLHHDLEQAISARERTLTIALIKWAFEQGVRAGRHQVGATLH